MSTTTTRLLIVSRETRKRSSRQARRRLLLGLNTLCFCFCFVILMALGILWKKNPVQKSPLLASSSTPTVSHTISSSGSPSPSFVLETLSASLSGSPSPSFVPGTLSASSSGSPSPSFVPGTLSASSSGSPSPSFVPGTLSSSLSGTPSPFFVSETLSSSLSGTPSPSFVPGTLTVSSSASPAHSSVSRSLSNSVSSTATPATNSLSGSPTPSFTQSRSLSLTKSPPPSPTTSPLNSPSPLQSFTPSGSRSPALVCESNDTFVESPFPCSCLVGNNITDLIECQSANQVKNPLLEIDLEYSFVSQYTHTIVITFQHPVSIIPQALEELVCLTGVILPTSSPTSVSAGVCATHTVFELDSSCFFQELQGDTSNESLFYPLAGSVNLSLYYLNLTTIGNGNSVELCTASASNQLFLFDLFLLFPSLGTNSEVFVNSYVVERDLHAISTHLVSFWAAIEPEATFSAVNSPASPRLLSTSLESALLTNSTLHISIEERQQTPRFCLQNETVCLELFELSWSTPQCSLQFPVVLETVLEKSLFPGPFVFFDNMTVNITLPIQNKCQLLLLADQEALLLFPLFSVANNTEWEQGAYQLLLQAPKSQDLNETLDLATFQSGPAFILCWQVVSALFGPGDILWSTVVVEAGGANLYYVPYTQQQISINGVDTLCVEHAFPSSSPVLNYHLFVRVQFNQNILVDANLYVEGSTDNATAGFGAELFQYHPLPSSSIDPQALRDDSTTSAGQDPIEVIRHHLLENLELVLWFVVFCLFACSLCTLQPLRSVRQGEEEVLPVSSLGEKPQHDFLKRYHAALVKEQQRRQANGEQVE